MAAGNRLAISGGLSREAVRGLFPNALKHPDNGIFLLPDSDRHRDQAGRMWDSLHNAANFAFANRMFLAVMALAGLRRVCGGRRSRIR